MTGKRIFKRVLKIIVCVILVLAVLAGVAYFFFDPYKGSVSVWKMQNGTPQQVMTKKQAVTDLEFIKDKVKSLHYSTINGLSPAFREQYDKEIAALTDHPTILQVWQAGSRILHTLNDGHSNLYGYMGRRAYGGAIYSIADGAVYIHINDQSYRVKKICGVDIDLLRQNASAQNSYENDLYRDYRFLSCLQTDLDLEWLGCPPFEVYTVDFDNNGKTQTATIPRNPTGSNQTKEKWVSYRIDKGNSVGILTLNSCKDNDEYRETLRNFFTEVKADGITNVAVDLRSNGGGSSYVMNDFIRYLNVDRYEDFASYHRLKLIRFKDPVSATVQNKKINDLLFSGKVYVLTSTETFSSAMQFSVGLQDNKLAKVIGEPSGNKPCQYGEVVTFLLPNSKLYFSTTYAYFERPDASKADMAYQMPDYPVSADAAVDKLCELTKGTGK